MSDILIADDDQLLATTIADILVADGYSVSIANNGIDALRMIKEDAPDLAILDVDMPGKTGVEVCREVRKESQLPIILLTALDGEEDGHAGYDAQANEYIVKGPQQGWQIKHKVKILLQNDHGFKTLLTFGNTELCTATKQVSIDGIPVDMPPAERDALQLLLQSGGSVACKEAMFQHLLGYENDGQSRALDRRIMELRKLLRTHHSSLKIETIRGKGYMLCRVD